jgi:hypothetical protein
MSYVNYNQSLYRTGFRPYGTTNPRAAAAMLSGYPSDLGQMDLGQTHVFGPWRLHGLGQSHPFTERGGWTLHGLGQSMIPDGTIVTYVGTWNSAYNTGGGISQPGYAQAISDGVVAALNQDGQLKVLSSPHDLSSGIVGAAKAIVGYGEPFTETLILQVTNGMGFGSVNDIISIVRHYVYTVSGQFPTSDAITGVHHPGDPSTPASLAPTPAGPVDLTTWFETNAWWIGLALAGVILGPSLLRRF